MKEKTKKQQIALENEDFRFLVDSLEDYGIFKMDSKGKIVSWNDGAKKIFGYTDKEALGKPVSLIFSHADKRLKMPALEIITATTKGRADDERQHRRKDGTLFWATGVMWSIKDEEGNLRGLSKLIRDISVRKKMEDTIRHQSLHDTLTGLPNRRSFNDRLTLVLDNAKKYSTMFAVLFLDLDNFKKVNDTLGHDTGDILLQEVATRLSKILRKGDTVCRIGGDEFILVMDNIKDKNSIKPIIKKLGIALKPVFNISNKKIEITASIGASVYPLDGKNSRILEKRADIALYQAKKAGKNRGVVYDTKIK